MDGRVDDVREEAQDNHVLLDAKVKRREVAVPSARADLARHIAAMLSFEVVMKETE